jgi:Trypsin
MTSARLRAAGALAVATLAVALQAATPAMAATAAPRVIGGTAVRIDQVPWQVAIEARNPPYLCGGAILDARRVLTAGHCVVPEGGSAPRPPADITVLAGFSNYTAYVPGQPAPPGTQVVTAGSVRVHPYFAVQPQLSDDLAIVTLSRPLDLSGPNAKPIALAASPVPPGTPVNVAGYGQQDQSRPPDGPLYATTLTAISDDDCRGYLNNTSPVVVCAQSPTSATCHGDSGGALTTTGGPPVLLGIVSFGPNVCGQGPAGFVDITAPEVRAFIDGAAQVPVAPRISAYTSMRWVLPPVQGSPLVCDPGAWSASPALTYTFQTDAPPVQALQSGPSATYVPRRADVGKPIVCVVAAANAGGTATARSATSPPIALDRVRPRSAVTYIRCSRRRCRIVLRAADPNSWGALRVRVTTRYRRRTRALTVKQIGRITYRATRSRLPYRRLRFIVRVSDAAGNRATTRIVRAAMHRR